MACKRRMIQDVPDAVTDTQMAASRNFTCVATGGDTLILSSLAEVIVNTRSAKQTDLRTSMLTIIGKRIHEVKVDKLAGASGTPRGFNATIERIRREAKTRQSGAR